MTTVAVLVRRVPDPSRLSIDKRTGKLRREGIPFILNPVDLQALELALRIREQAKWRVVVLAADHDQGSEELREAIAMGADEAVLVQDASLDGTDPGMQAHVFRAALEKFAQPQIVMTAARSIDHTWSTIGPQLAQVLGWPLVIEAESIEVTGNGVRALAHTGSHRAHVEAPLPCVVSVSRHAASPRHATSWGVADAFDEHRLRVVDFDALDLSPERDETLRTRTKTRGARVVGREREGRVLEGDEDDVARRLSRILIDQGWGGKRP